MSPVTLPGGVNPHLDTAIRDAAEALASESYEAMCRVRDPKVHPGPLLSWVLLGESQRAFDVGGYVALLRDLSRPASRDWCARWLAAHHGLQVGATAPRWYCDDDGGRRATRYTLEGEDGTWLTFYDPANTLDTFGTGGRPIPRLPTDPAEALRAACLAAVGRSA